MASPTNDGPNVRFLRDAQAFLESKSVAVQGELIALASWLFGDPGVDGERKFLVMGPRQFGVRTYRRAFIDDDYTIVYEFDEQADPPMLIVIDIFETPR